MSDKSYLERAVVPESPHACRHWDGRDEEERHEDQEPVACPMFHAVTHQHLEGEQEQVDPHSNQHGLKLHAGLPLGPADDNWLHDIQEQTHGFPQVLKDMFRLPAKIRFFTYLDFFQMCFLKVWTAKKKKHLEVVWNATCVAHNFTHSRLSPVPQVTRT